MMWQSVQLEKSMTGSDHSGNDAQVKRTPHYQAGSLSLMGAVAMWIGAGIFALTGQVAELTGDWFSPAFFAAGIETGFSAYLPSELPHHRSSSVTAARTM